MAAGALSIGPSIFFVCRLVWVGDGRDGRRQKVYETDYCMQRCTATPYLSSFVCVRMQSYTINTHEHQHMYHNIIHLVLEHTSAE